MEEIVTGNVETLFDRLVASDPLAKAQVLRTIRHKIASYPSATGEGAENLHEEMELLNSLYDILLCVAVKNYYLDSDNAILVDGK